MRSNNILLAILLIQLATLVSIFFNVFFARQLLGFLFVAFIPGYLILRLLKFENLHFNLVVFLSLGVSVAFIMFLGLLLNTVLPILGFTDPLSTFPILVSINLFVSVSCVILWGRSQSSISYPAPSLRLLPVIILLLSIPFATVVGTEIARVSGDTRVLLLLVVLTSLIVFCAFSTKLIPPEIYPLAILVMALFLLFHVSLISSSVIGSDIHQETYFAQLTFANAFWNRTIFQPYNAMLSVTILPVVFANFLNLDITWIFKITYPLVYSFVPVILYFAFRKQTNSLVAFLAVFLFMSMDTFYVQMLGLARQMIGELFFALLILLIIDEKLGTSKKRILFYVFSIALVLSHYSLAYLFLFLSLVTFSVSSYFKHSDRRMHEGVPATPAQPTSAKSLTDLSAEMQTLRREISEIKQDLAKKYEANQASSANGLITGKFILGYGIITTFWYIFAVPAASKNFADALGNIYNALISSMVGPGVSGLVPAALSPAHQVHQYVFYLLQFLVVVGVFALIMNRKKSQFKPEYAGMSIGSMLLLLMSIFLPNFAASLNISRVYHISLFLLAPFCVIGGMSILGLISNIRSRLRFPPRKLDKATSRSIRKALMLLIAVLLVCLFMFQVGFIYIFSGDNPISISLSRDRTNWSTYMYFLDANQQEILACKWLPKYAGNGSTVYADEISQHYVTSYGLIPTGSQGALYPGAQYIATENSCFFFGWLSMEKGGVFGLTETWNLTNFSAIFNNDNNIYSNGASDIYCKPSQ